MYDEIEATDLRISLTEAKKALTNRRIAQIIVDTLHESEVEAVIMELERALNEQDV